MTNPLDLLEARLISIENLILDLKHNPQQVDKAQTTDQAATLNPKQNKQNQIWHILECCLLILRLLNFALKAGKLIYNLWEMLS